MSLNSEPIPQNNDLLSLIDAGIAALETDDQTPLELTAELIFKRENESK